MSGFLAELKRRNVFRMAGLYLVGAWLLVQIAETLLPIFHTPDWVLQTLVVLLALGFLPALVFSWIYELTPKGLKRDADVDPAHSVAPRTAQRMDRLILAGLAAVILVVAADRYWPSTAAPELMPTETGTASSPAETARTTDSAEALSIAVLPFLNMSPDAENAYFADGISEELLNVLSRIDGLKVASRTSAFSFKGKDTPIPEIARLLDVRHVLEGSVRKQGQRVRITAQLIDSRTDGHLWSQTYDRELADIFAVQEEIAQAIVGELRGILGQRKVIVSVSTAKLDAYERFLRGRARFHQRRELRAAIDDLAMAVEQDPQFAEAWVYLAAAQAVAPGYENNSDHAAAEAAAAVSLAQARRLLPQHPMVLGVQGLLADGMGDMVAAMEYSVESARLSTQDSTPVMWLGTYLLRGGYIDEAVTTLERAERMDPRVGVNVGNLAYAYLAAGRPELAETKSKLALELGWPYAQYGLALDMAARGVRERAMPLLAESLALLPSSDPSLDAAMLAAVAYPAQADAYWSLKRTKPHDTEPPEESIALGQPQILFDYLQARSQIDESVRDPAWWLRSAWLPYYAAVREDPRFFAFADKYGLVRLWETRGYPPGCQRASEPSGDRLDCPGMRR